jgi:hypothetical protein
MTNITRKARMLRPAMVPTTPPTIGPALAVEATLLGTESAVMVEPEPSTSVRVGVRKELVGSRLFTGVLVVVPVRKVREVLVVAVVDREVAVPVLEDDVDVELELACVVGVEELDLLEVVVVVWEEGGGA